MRRYTSRAYAAGAHIGVLPEVKNLLLRRICSHIIVKSSDLDHNSSF
jgi:hypothetical protein